MAKNYSTGYTIKKKTKTSIWWGLSLIMVAALVLANALGGFTELSFFRLAIAALALVSLIQALASFNFGYLPLPIGALYWIFQDYIVEWTGVPELRFWTIALVAILLSTALFALLPKKRWIKKFTKDRINVNYSSPNKTVTIDTDDDTIVIDTNDGTVIDVDTDEGESAGQSDAGENFGGKKTKVNETGGENNPSISVQFGAISRYLHADALETANLDCSFGSLEVYFDNVTLHPNGAVVSASCKFGNLEIYVPSHWRVIDQLGASLGNAEVDRELVSNNDDSAPKLTVLGNVSLGNLEVVRLK